MKRKDLDINYVTPILSRFETRERRYSPIVIVGVFANPAGDDVQPQRGEFVVLENLCQTAIKLSGWRIGYAEPFEVLGPLDMLKMQELREAVQSPRLSPEALEDRLDVTRRQKENALVLPIGTVIMPSRRLQVHTGPGRQTSNQVFCNRRRPVWNNSKGTARLYDSTGALLQTFSYGNA